MKSVFLSLIAFTVPALAFGLDKAEQKLVNDSAIIETLLTIPANGGINPQMAGVEVTVQVMKGGNDCVADATTLDMKVTRLNRKSYLHVSRKVAEVFCPMHYAPVYTTITKTFSLKASELNDLKVVNFKTPGVKKLSTINTKLYSHYVELEHVTFVSLESVNGDTEVNVLLLQGMNKCEASNRTIELAHDKTQNAIYGKVTRQNRIACPEIYQPEYRNYTVKVSSEELRTLAFVNFRGAKLMLQDSLVNKYRGNLIRMAAIGGESTGYGIEMEDGSMVELDPAKFGNNLDKIGRDNFEAAMNNLVVVSGFFETRLGVERPSRQVFVVTQFERLAVAH